ncbi:hypothetical protein BDV93DRAFT_517412 [Ceratobasidium sp. AG-I]|nr:hypothetical protein BDV93DRAFT_517412 [Ceratobasidium sp. AG-I]
MKSWLGLAAISVLPVAYSATTSDWMKQSFFFSWGNSSQPFTIPATAQCETIRIQWQRGTATGPDPVAPYTLQILTSNYVTPFYIDAGSSLTYDYTVPFAPGTQYQICMYDSNGATGGCQASYTVYAASQTAPTCTNVTFPASLEVEALSSSGPLSQYGWPNQCTDISLTPKTGTPPFTFTAAPALHPPVNITSNSMKPINWTIDLSWGAPFFVTLSDSAGLSWSYGPLHSGGNGPTACLAGGTTGGIPLGATVGGAVGAFVVGALIASLIFFCVSRKTRRRHHNRPSLDLKETSSGDLQPTPYMGGEMGNRGLYSPLNTYDGSLTTEDIPTLASTGYRTEPFNPSALSASGGRTATGTQRSSSPPMSPAERTERDTRSQVYVVHHDGGRAPVTIMTSDGAEVVELPPGYVNVPESSRQSGTEAVARTGKSGR